MINLSGQSIAAVSDSFTKNGKSNTMWAAGILGALIIVSGGCYVVGKNLINNNKHSNNQARSNNEHTQKMELQAQKHTHKMEEIERKEQADIAKIKARREARKEAANFDPDIELEANNVSELVPTYDDLINGDDVEATDLRLGLRCFHIGQDNGLIGRSNIGKTTFLFSLAKAICTNSQDDGAVLSPDWCLSQPMKVLYFAFEQGARDFKVKYGKYIKSIPNLHIDVTTSAGDFQSIMKKIKTMQNEIGSYRLLVIFDNITKMKHITGKEKSSFFKWLDSYRQECESKGKPITYLKAFHTQGRYTDDMPIEITTNYGSKTDTYFTHNLVGFGICKGGDGKLRYLKELKNKFEGEKATLSVYRFADTLVPLYDYVEEAEEIVLLPTKADLVRGGNSVIGDATPGAPCRRGPKEIYSLDELIEMWEEKEAGFTWREILESRKITYHKDKTKGIIKAMKRHGIMPKKAA